ncbi:MAG: 4Fe-4S binding protein [Coriobacteriia bacterium]|nr:4Fe-4S binding protein [Coriobacteriia bacterium]
MSEPVTTPAPGVPPVPDRRGPGPHRYRRYVQVAFLALFLIMLTLTVWPLGQVFLGAFLIADPLIALNSLAGGVWKPAMALAGIMLLIPLAAGRVFCGYACPTGALLEWTTPTRAPEKPGLPGRFTRSRVPAGARPALRAAPAFVLIACGGLLLFASGAYLWLDPLATLTRTATVLLYPLLDRLARLIADVLYLAPPLQPGVDAVNGILTGRIVFARPLAYGLQGWVLGWAALLVGLNVLEPRLWCRHLCPLGALLGLVARFGFVGRRVDADACIHCGRCEVVCPLDAVRDDHLATDPTRCQQCSDCADVCPTTAISIGNRGAKSAYSPGRRALLGGAGLAMLGGFFSYTGLSRRTRDVRLVRPPGAPVERDVLALCTRCGQCMKVCPTNVIQPAVSRAGLEGVFTPEMDYGVAFCDWSCNECGKVCPTGAIMPLTLEVKRTTRIGRAYLDRNRCIPWADYKTCLVCQELCPVPDKAITLHEVTVTNADGVSVKLGRPEVVADRCIGCGVCENACPVVHESAILVRANEPERGV